MLMCRGWAVGEVRHIKGNRCTKSNIAEKLQAYETKIKRNSAREEDVFVLFLK